MQSKEERDAYWANRRKKEKITGKEHEITLEERSITNLAKASQIAHDRGDEDFCGTLETEIQKHKDKITELKREIIMIEADAEFEKVEGW